MQPTSKIRNTAKEVKTARRIRNIIIISVIAFVIALILIYIISVLYSRYGSFTVSIKDYKDTDYQMILSDKYDFLHPTSYLNTTAVQRLTNIDGNKLPIDLNDVDGSHNGDNYMAYTFYLKNTGSKECSYEYTLSIAKKTRNIDDCIRVRLYYNTDFYKDGEFNFNNNYLDYAKPAVGKGGAPEIDPDNRIMNNFFNGNVVVRDQIHNFNPGDITKVTVVIWLEGNDPECTDDKLGGEIKLDLVFNILDEEQNMATKDVKVQSDKPTVYDEPGYCHHKFLNDIGCEDFIGFDDKDIYDIKRWRGFRTYEQKFGVFVSNCWALDHAMLRYLYEHLMQYKKDASKIVDLSFHKFEYKDKEYTQIELIDKLIEICEYILMDLKKVHKGTKAYKRLKENSYYKEYGKEYWEVEFQHPEIEKEVWDIWAIIYPAMWW